MNDNTNTRESTPHITEADQLRRLADRMRRDGRPATAVLLDNAAFLAEGGTMDEYAWVGIEGKPAEDVTVREQRS